MKMLALDVRIKNVRRVAPQPINKTNSGGGGMTPEMFHYSVQGGENLGFKLDATETAVQYLRAGCEVDIEFTSIYNWRADNGEATTKTFQGVTVKAIRPGSIGELFIDPTLEKVDTSKFGLKSTYEPPPSKETQATAAVQDPIQGDDLNVGP